MSDKIDYFAEEIPRHSVNGATWFLLRDYSKIPGEKNDSKTKLLNKKEVELKYLERRKEKNDLCFQMA